MIFALALGAVGLLAYCVLLYASFGNVTRDETEMTVSEVAGASFAIEPTTPTRDFYDIRGWVVIRGESMFVWDNQVVLRNDATGETLELPTMMEQRPDVTRRLNAGVRSADRVNYDTSGFVARVPRELVTEPLDSYSILIAIRSDGRDLLIDTQRTLG